MPSRCFLGLILMILTWSSGLAPAQEPAAEATQASKPAEEPPPVPKGVEVLGRGPVHEAFATPHVEPQATKVVPKQPPRPIEEIPPEEKPEGDMVWIGGYWHWDDERNDFLWVSGIWRKAPAGKRWVPGYWRESAGQWQWVPGFWTAVTEGAPAQDVTYLPAPPKPPEVASPGPAPSPDTFYVPGHWEWRGTHYVWRAGYWARVQPGYVWVPARYVWTPSGYVFLPGYWDHVVADRGVLYAPVVIDPVVVGPTFVYTPTYVVRDEVVVDCLFVRPAYCHYYFGDYYGATYVSLGYESSILYSRRYYDPIIVYRRYEYRSVPDWDVVQVNLYYSRYNGHAPRPPRTLVQQNITNVKVVNQTNITTITNGGDNTVLVAGSQYARSRGQRTEKIDGLTRAKAKEQAQRVQAAADERKQSELAAPGGAPVQPRTARISVPDARPVRSGVLDGTAPRNAASGKPMVPGRPAASSAVLDGTHPPASSATTLAAPRGDKPPSTDPPSSKPGSPALEPGTKTGTVPSRLLDGTQRRPSAEGKGRLPAGSDPRTKPGTARPPAGNSRPLVPPARPRTPPPSEDPRAKKPG